MRVLARYVDVWVDQVTCALTCEMHVATGPEVGTDAMWPAWCGEEGGRDGRRGWR